MIGIRWKISKTYVSLYQNRSLIFHRTSVCKPCNHDNIRNLGCSDRKNMCILYVHYATMLKVKVNYFKGNNKYAGNLRTFEQNRSKSPFVKR
jgi:CRISPR/Cas system-associated endonuclease Cas1